jgi:TonB family protein
LTREEIRSVIRQSLPKLKGCYERALVSDPKLSGKIVIKAVIPPSGSVSTVEIQSSTLTSVNLEGCVLRVVRRMIFPPPKSGGVVTVVYPFNFSFY